MADGIIQQVVNSDLLNCFFKLVDEDPTLVSDIQAKFDIIKDAFQELLTDDAFDKLQEGYRMTRNYNQSAGGSRSKVVGDNIKQWNNYIKADHAKNIQDLTEKVMGIDLALEELRHLITNEDVIVAISWWEGESRRHQKIAYIPKNEILNQGLNLLTNLDYLGRQCLNFKVNLQKIKNTTDYKIDKVNNRFLNFVKGTRVSAKNTPAKIKIEDDNDAFEVYAIYNNSAVSRTYEKYIRNEKIGENNWKPDWENYIEARTIMHDSSANYKSGERHSNVESKHTKDFNAKGVGNDLFNIGSMINQFNVLNQIFNNSTKLNLSSLDKALQLYNLYYGENDVKKLIELLQDDKRVDDKVKQELKNKGLDYIPNITIK